MTNEEKRLRQLKKLLLVKICREEDRRFSKRIYFKIRKWNPIVIVLLVWNVARYILESSYDFIKELVSELNEEDFIEIFEEGETKEEEG